MERIVAQSPAEVEEKPWKVALLGSRQAGKTSSMRRLASLLAELGVAAGGVVQPALRRKGTVLGYDLLDLRDASSLPFARLLPDPPAGSPCFSFVPEGWAWAAERICAARSSCAVVMVDELGRLEADGRGHWPALLAPLTEETTRCLVLGVRADRAEVIGARLGGFDRTLNVPTSDEALALLASQVAARVALRRNS